MKMSTIDPEQREMLAQLYEKAKIKIIIKDNDNLLANAQLLVGGIQEINGIQIWWSDLNNNINIKPPTYDKNHKCNAIWIRDEKIWYELCKRIEKEYKDKKDRLGIDSAIEEIPW